MRLLSNVALQLTADIMESRPLADARYGAYDCGSAAAELWRYADSIRLEEPMTVRLATGLLALALCWVSPLSAQDRQGPQSTDDMRQFYSVYEAALKSHRRDTLSQFYHPAGALIVLNGGPMALSHARIDSTYRGAWEGPAFFSFDDLQFHVMSPVQVVVTGGFRWLRPQSADTTRYVYLALVERGPTGLRIRVEHETERPRQQR